jgi:histidyl-tRNA synthetase
MARPRAPVRIPRVLPSGTDRRAARARRSCGRTFELHGFAGIETRAVEPMDQLRARVRSTKEVYVLRRLRRTRTRMRPTSSGLHFDLTVPFARYVLENAGHLAFPFRRYQIQKVWRGERPQEGRYREFTQADIDIVGENSLAAHHDVEIPLVMLEALENLHVRRRAAGVLMRVNNRQLAEGFYRGLGIEDTAAVLQRVDKLDKIGAAAVVELLVAEIGLDAEQRVQGVCPGPDPYGGRLVRRPGASAGREPRRCWTRASSCSLPSWPRPARPYPDDSSPTSRSRAASTTTPGPCTRRRWSGTSRWARSPPAAATTRSPRRQADLPGRRHLARREPDARAAARQGPPRRQPQRAHGRPGRRDRRGDPPEADAVARALRARGIPTEVAPKADKFGKQIRHADRRGIPYVWFGGTRARSRTSAPATSGRECGHLGAPGRGSYGPRQRRLGLNLSLLGVGGPRKGGEARKPDPVGCEGWKLREGYL